MGFNLYLVKIPSLLDRKDVYGYGDESHQFIAFQHALLHWICVTNHAPDLFHCHDHHSGLVPFFIEHCDDFKSLKGIPTLATVHNGQYQGWMNWHEALLLPAFDADKWGLLDWDGMINPLAALIKCCWAYNTVSEGYLKELFRNANGLEALFLAEKPKSNGIVNGIDTEVWNPMTDAFLNFPYHATDLAGKNKNKKAFNKRYRLNSKLPLFSFIGRLVYEKGADLLPFFIEEVMKVYHGQVNFMILGSGDPIIEKELQTLPQIYPENLIVEIGYNEELSHHIYASSDFLFMPSRVEPCGLNQLYAMRYGTMPVVRKTGGLADTVIDISKEGYGILFESSTVEDMMEAMKMATTLYQTKIFLKRKQEDMMKLDFSWEVLVQKYKQIYNRLINQATNKIN